MRPALIARHIRRVERIAASAGNIAALPDELVSALDDAIGCDALCSGTLDPETMIPTALTLVGHSESKVSTAEALSVVLAADEHNRKRALANLARPVEILSGACDGDVERSAHYRHVLSPQGFEHSLLLMLVINDACWGFLDFLRHPTRPDFTAADAELANALAPALARSLRDSLLELSDRSLPVGLPGVIVLDEQLAIGSISPEGRRWLAELSNADEGLPAVVQAVAAAALLESNLPAHARARTHTGAWLHVHATVLEGQPHRGVAVVLESARPDQLVPVVARAHGLTAREREIAALVVQGHSTAQIAGELFLSPYTVKDHLKAVFDKVEVRSRRDLAAALGSASNQRSG